MTIMEQISLRDGVSIVSTAKEAKTGLRLRDMYPSAYSKFYPTAEARKIHDGNFAFVMTTLSKLHEKVYSPKYNTTYGQDVPINVGGGLVDFVDFFTVEWAGMPTEQQNLTGNNINIIPRVNAKLNHEKVNVYNFEIAYDIKFIEIDKLNKVNMPKALEAIYKDAIVAGWDIFADKIAYEGANGAEGLFTSSKVLTTLVPQGTKDITQNGFSAMKDEEIVGFVNGVLSYYLINTNNNLSLLPDTFLMPTTGASELSKRYSPLYTNTLRQFLMTFNVGIDEYVASGAGEFKLKIKGRPRLEGAGTLGGGRVVAYRFDADFIRMDIPYPVQVYYTAPNVERMCYSTYFVGQISDCQFPYNKSDSEIGPVTYWDLTPASGIIKFDAGSGTGKMADFIATVGTTQTLPENTFTYTLYDFAGWTTDPEGTAVEYLDEADIVIPYGTTTLYALWTLSD